MEVLSVFSDKFANISENVHRVLLEDTEKEGRIFAFDL